MSRHFVAKITWGMTKKRTKKALLVARYAWVVGPCVYITVYLLHIVAATAANHIAYASLAMLMVNYGCRVILTRPPSKCSRCRLTMWRYDRMLIGNQNHTFLTMLTRLYDVLFLVRWSAKSMKTLQLPNFVKDPDGFLIRPQFWSSGSGTKKDRECDALHVQV